MQKIQGFVEQGNTTLIISGAAGIITRKVQGSFPSATLTVYLAGTVTLASIYADDSGTSKANPFVAASDGTWYFYVQDGVYDVHFAGGGIPVPFTLGALPALDPTSPGGIRNAIGFPGTTMVAKINAAIADLPSSGGVINACGFEGAQSIASPINTLGKRVAIMFGGITISLSVTLFIGGGQVFLSGANVIETKINYTAASGAAIDFSDMNHVGMQNISMYATSAGNTAIGVKLYRSQHPYFDNIVADGFDFNFHLSATNVETTRTFDARFNNVQSTNFLTAGFSLDHSVDIYFTNVMDWAAYGNATDAHALIIDTGTSGVHINGMSVIAGGVIVRHTLATAAAFDFPPEFIHAHQLISDTITGMPAIHLDQTLLLDAFGRSGKSYRFAQCWSAFTLTDGMPGILIEGGQNVSFIDPLLRLNRYHGIHITGGNNIRIINPLCLGNNQQNAADGDGIHVDAGINNFTILGGVSANNTAGESGHQRYGIRVENGVSANYIIAGVDCSQGNETNGIFDGGLGQHQLYGNLGTVDNGGGNVVALYDRRFETTARMEFGDGGNYWEFKPGGVNTVNFASDIGDYVEYDRTNNQWSWFIANIARARLSGVGGVGARLFLGSGGSSYFDWKVTDPNQVVWAWDTGDYVAFELTTNRKFTNIGNVSITTLSAGGLGVFGETDPSAALTVTSSTKGFLLPRLTTAERDAIAAPADGLLIYNATTGFLNFVQGGTWHVVTSV